MRDVRARHSAALLRDGRVLVAGDDNGNSVFLVGAELYTAATGTSSSTGNLNMGRFEHTATLTEQRPSAGRRWHDEVRLR
jgi:hypothetical protein